MTPSECEAFIADLGSPRYRATQMMRWLYLHGATSFAQMTNLSKDFRTYISQRARIGTISIHKKQTSVDGTKKILFLLEDGNLIESVLIPGKNHWTVCVSTQVGCRMACSFCMTGSLGFKRNLRPSEIAGQISVLLKEVPPEIKIKNIVMMGMGEPLDNYDNLIKAIGIITSQWCIGFSALKITVSTCGVVPKIASLGEETRVNLAVSLNAADNETRSKLMPINKSYPIEALLFACRHYPMPAKRMITFEYILIKDINDSVRDAKKLALLLRGIKCKLNLIAWNNFPHANFHPPTLDRMSAFRDELIKNHYTAIIRTSKGGDILAACGQLSGKEYAKSK